MAVQCPSCGRLNPETARLCDCGIDLAAVGARAAESIRAAADPAPAVRLPRRCPLCEGANVRLDGWAATDTRVQFGTRWIAPGNTGYGLNCFACFDCGFVGHYLGPKDLENLQTRPVSDETPVRSSSSGCLGAVLLLVGLGVACVVAGRLLLA